MLHHVGIEVAPADLARSVEFWELLGFARVEPPAVARRRFTWLERGGTQIHLMHERLAERPAARRTSQSSPRTSSATFAALADGRLRGRAAPRALGGATGQADRPGRPPRRADGRPTRSRGELPPHSGSGSTRPYDRPSEARRAPGYDAPVRYPVEQFTAEERALLAPHFTNLDRPVFALVNLPETVKGALFARYSRYSGTVRRLYLEEFAADAPGRRPPLRRRGGRARREALRARLPRLRRRLDRPGRRRPRRLRVGLQHPHQGRCSAAASPPTSSSRPATSPTTSRSPEGGRLPLLPRRASSGPSSAPRWTSSSRSTRARSSGSRSGRRSAGRAATASPRAPGSARSAPRRSTCCAACCRPRPSATSASTPPARPTSS